MSTKKNTAASLSFAPNIVVAHRGAWKKNNLPENSIASLKEAVRIGCTGSEFDVHLTADDSLVVNHDAHYAGLTIEKSTYAELSATKLSNGEMLPTVYHYLKEGMQQTKTMMVLEIKPSTISKERGQYLAEKVVTLVKQLRAEPWIMYISFDYDILKKILELQPGAKTAYLNGEKTPEQLAADKIWGVDYHYAVFKKNNSWIADAQKLGVNLNVWTVNNAEDMEWFINNKFDYITTNEPELLFDLIDKKGR
ncbi:glycerophosphodiester phosphodiesterase family protein [Agriterribacter sp.]|uniref:glycerophosphodiester phosphodiesterase family protein n=1 Tax=Agriterribacter sp. TaxID=2821509 RepID=UPI002BC8BF23|nr:glycerophosphodiester phosphodiesterase family protein [Agriterribacter sp.]HRO45212.1 glycerophosphodiester phosphodiesterase family protein [Agriterribacter sp.]HRQ16815.1 glycerophosphodiester phosphodiesterase family protein [Agriterribacter sp.]